MAFYVSLCHSELDNYAFSVQAITETELNFCHVDHLNEYFYIY